VILGVCVFDEERRGWIGTRVKISKSHRQTLVRYIKFTVYELGFSTITSLGGTLIEVRLVQKLDLTLSDTLRN
jgi:hypothetical protein